MTKNILCPNAREDGFSLGEASENNGLSFGDLTKTAGAAAIGSLVVGLGIEGGKRLIFGKSVFGDKAGRVTVRGDVADIHFGSPEQAEKVADQIKVAAKEARAAKEKAEEEKAKKKKADAKKKKEQEAEAEAEAA